MTPAKGVHLLHTAPTPVPTGFVNHMEAEEKEPFYSSILQPGGSVAEWSGNWT